MTTDAVPRVLNSLSGSKERLSVLQERRLLTWYTCGPTVYDAAHIGHARNYVCFDVLRRIVTDYFGVDVRLQMNVTDVDDKIIARSAERGVPFSELARHYEREFFGDLRALHCRPPDIVTRVSDYVPEILRYIEKIVERGYAYVARSGSVYFDVDAFERQSTHVYGKLEASSARVSSESGGGGGSEDTRADGSSCNRGGSDNDNGAAADVDTAPATGSVPAEKRSARDFALWKASKTDDEAGWPSASFGRGRPGWHIECSAMASAITPEPPLDVHSGGVDLRFPHHDNEIAQAEAYHDCEHWCRFFLHAGHLHIEGLKMSKSLKNFITIGEILRRWSWRQVRMLFLQHRYEAPMNYSEDAMSDAAAVERTVSEFMKGTEAELRTAQLPRKPSAADLRLLYVELPSCRDKVHVCLADNFDTPGALHALLALIKATNVYRSRSGGASSAASAAPGADSAAARNGNSAADGNDGARDASASVNASVLGTLRTYIGKMLGVFGLDYSDGGDGEAASNAATMMDALAAFRDRVRAEARAADNAVLLDACDSVRDDVLPSLGVRLEDRPDTPSAIWKRDDPASIQRDVERRREQERAKAEAKAARKREEERRQREELYAGRLEPHRMFRDASAFSRWRDDGVPTRDVDGNALEKSRVKKMAKEQQRQRKLHDKFVEARASGLLQRLGLERGDARDDDDGVGDGRRGERDESVGCGVGGVNAAR